MKRIALYFLILLVGAGAVLAQGNNPTLFRQPTVSQSSIVFVYAGDLWSVSRDGGDAVRLTTGVGIESNPHFSPDGRWIAFSGQYDGNTDVFVVSAGGGIPRRLTYHPSSDAVTGWTADGKKVLFTSTRVSYANFNRLYALDVTGGGLPEEMPLPMVNRADMSPDGTHVAYEPLSQWQADWKYYKGGQTQPIWIADLSDSSIVKVPRNNSNDKQPMWIGDKVYFLSDRDNGIVTLFCYDTKSNKVEKIINNQGLDIKSASANGKDIVYEQFGTIYTLKAGSKKAKKINIRVAGDFPGVRKRYVNVGNRISSATISPTGARAIFEARGEIFSAPADKGNARNLTNTTGAMERDPAWSPDGKHIAYFSDESGEYMLHLRDQTGMGEVKKVKLGDKPGFFFSPTWSPDSKKIAYLDQQVNLWYLDIATGKSIRVDTNPIGVPNNVMTPSWSPDSKWITYPKQMENRLRAVFLYSLDSKKSHQITDGYADTHYVVFDQSGKYLYLTGSTDVGPTISFADLSGIAHQVTHSVYMVVLRNDIPSPLAPESDEEKIKPEQKEKPKTEKEEKPEAETDKKPEEKPKAEKPAEKGPKPIRIDLDGIDQRIIAIPQVPTRNFNGLYAGKAGTLYLTEVPQGPQAPGQAGLILHKFDLKERKLDTPKRGISGFTLSADGSKMLYRQGRNWFVISTLRPSRPGQGRVKTNEMQAYVDPKVEWEQMFDEVWRGERDFLYDPGTHGLDINKAKALYKPYLQAIAHREDLNYLFREMLNQISIGHMYIGGGESPRPTAVRGGLLGADYKIENGRYRFARVYNGENWNPRLRAPLTAPGVNVKASEYLLGVDGRDIRSTDNRYQFC
jgi:tricorn protease